MVKIEELRLSEVPAPAARLAMVASTTAAFTISGFSWAPIQDVQSNGAEIGPGDAGELAVRMYGSALEKLADS